MEKYTDQEFFYKQTPVNYDGIAKFTSIKGNTLGWNQLVKNGNFASTDNWTNEYVTASVSNNVISVTGTRNGNNYIGQNYQGGGLGHKYYFRCDYYTPGAHNDALIAIYTGSTNQRTTFTPTEYGKWLTYQAVINNDASATTQYQIRLQSRINGIANQFRNCMLIDLTQMYGSGNEPTADEFVSLFNLPYYDYNQGTLIPFSGNGIKTVGKNIVSSFVSNLNVTQYGTALQCEADLKPNTTYTISFVGQNGLAIYPNENLFTTQSWVTMNGQRQFVTLTTKSELPSTQKDSNGWYIFKKGNGPAIAFTIPFEDVQIELGSTASSYEPYKESTTDLPVLTYFPSGMKSAGTVYDELTPTKAITRIGAVNLGTLTWERTTTQGSDYRFFSSGISSVIKKPNTLNDVANIICSKYQAERGNGPNAQEVGVGIHTNGNVLIYDTAYASATAEEFKSAMSGVYLYYELATPTETTVDLDLDFMAYEDGTEQLLPVNGSVPSTSPIIADMTYLSIDDAMEYVLEKLANVPQNTQQILESLEDDVADLQTDVGSLQTSVSGLQTSVGNINTNIGQLSSTVAGHTSSISDMQSDISDLNTGLSNLEDTVTDDTSRIGTLETDLASTDSQVQSLGSSVSTLSSTVSDQGTELGEIDSIIQDISNNPVISALGSHELGFVAAYVDATLPANTGTRVTIPKPTIFPNNYTPLFIVGMSTGAYDVSICEIPHTFGNSDSVKCRVWNHGSQKTTQITVYILCMRQRQSQ